MAITIDFCTSSYSLEKCFRLDMVFLKNQQLFYYSSVLYVVLEHFYVNLFGVFEKINVFLINTVLRQLTVFANDMVFLKSQFVIGKIALFYYNSVRYVVLEHFYVNQFLRKSYFLHKHCFRPSQVIANHMVFLKNQQLFIGKMAWFYCSSVLYVVLEHFHVNLIESF